MKKNNFIFIFSILSIISSCKPNKQIARILKRNPQLIVTDTVFKKDTVFFKEVQKDTTFFYNQKDTVYFTQGKLQVKYFYNTRDSLVYLQAKCRGDTIIKVVPIKVNKIIVQPITSKWARYKKYFVIALFGAFILLIIEILIRFLFKPKK